VLIFTSGDVARDSGLPWRHGHQRHTSAAPLCWPRIATRAYSWRVHHRQEYLLAALMGLRARLAQPASTLVDTLGTEIDPLLWRPQTWGLTLQLFKSNRTDRLKRGMSPDPVIEALHILEDGLPGLGTRMARK